MTERKNFNYKEADIDAIVQQFKKSSRQTIFGVRKNWKDDPVMTDKLDKAFLQYKIDVLTEKLSVPSDSPLS